MRYAPLLCLPLLVACAQMAQQEGVHEYGCVLSGISYEVMNNDITVLKCEEPNVVIMCKTPTFQVSSNIYTCEDSKGIAYKVLDKTTQDAQIDAYIESLDLDNK